MPLPEVGNILYDSTWFVVAEIVFGRRQIVWALVRVHLDSRVRVVMYDCEPFINRFGLLWRRFTFRVNLSTTQYNTIQSRRLKHTPRQGTSPATAKEGHGYAPHGRPTLMGPGNRNRNRKVRSQARSAKSRLITLYRATCYPQNTLGNRCESKRAIPCTHITQQS